MEKNNSEKSLLISLQIYSLQGLAVWELSTGSSRQGCSSAKAWPLTAQLWVCRWWEKGRESSCCSVLGALPLYSCLVQFKAATQHWICGGQWAASSNSGSQGGIFQDKSWVRLRRGRQSNPQTCGFWEQVAIEADPCRQRLLDSWGSWCLLFWGSVVQWVLVLRVPLPSLASSRTWYEENEIHANWNPKAHTDSPV